MRQHLAKRRARAIDLTQSKISGRRTGEYVADEHPDKTAASEQRIGRDLISYQNDGKDSTAIAGKVENA
jgi:hypothetical protein